MDPAEYGPDAFPLPVRPRFPGWVLPACPRPASDDTPWAPPDPDLLRDLLDGLEAL